MRVAQMEAECRSYATLIEHAGTGQDIACRNLTRAAALPLWSYRDCIVDSLHSEIVESLSAILLLCYRLEGVMRMVRCCCSKS